MTTLVGANIGLTSDHEAAILALAQVYAAGGPVVTADVTAARVTIARRAAGLALLAKVSGASASYINEEIQPYISDGTKPAPSWAAYQAIVAGLA